MEQLGREFGIELAPIRVSPPTSVLSDITYLNLGKAKLKTLNPMIGELKALTSFFCHENEIASLPSEIADLPQLRIIESVSSIVLFFFICKHPQIYQNKPLVVCPGIL